MKQLVVTLFVATFGLVLPALPAEAGTSNPAAYQPFCEQGYQAMRPVFDAVLSPGKAVFGPVETVVCGEQKYTPLAA